MSLPVTATAAGARAEGRFRYDWLFSRRADLGMLFVPVIAMGFAFAVALKLGQGQEGSVRASAGWVQAYLFGSASHVLLTFLLLGTRRDVLHAAERQARSVIVGSLVLFGGSLALMRFIWHSRWPSSWNGRWPHPLFDASVGVFAIHHTLSQVKGVWALYGLRGAQAGGPVPSERERELQKLFVPLGLLVIAIKWTLVGESSTAGATPLMNPTPSDPAVLPFAVTYGLVGAWLAYVAVLFRTLCSYETLNAAKLIYLGTQCSVVTLELCFPGWGVTIGSSIHGLEYYLLNRKMLTPTARESSSKLTSARCWPAMIVAMSPIIAFGVLTNPLGAANLLGDNARTWWRMIIDATIIAHYCADALMYRFRIPGVRKVALARLGFTR